MGMHCASWVEITYADIITTDFMYLVSTSSDMTQMFHSQIFNFICKNIFFLWGFVDKQQWSQCIRIWNVVAFFKLFHNPWKSTESGRG